MAKNTVTINGNVYDAETGDIINARRTARTAASSASELHAASAQKSQTLQRKYLNKTKRANATPERAAPKIIHRSRKVRTVQDIRHPNVTRFAKTIPTNNKPQHGATRDIAPAPHQLEQVARKRQAAAKQTRTPLPSQVIKQQAIQEATDKMISRDQRKSVKPARQTSLWRRLVSVGSGALAVLLLGAYFTYINMPALSTRVAAAQAGINASYPNYQPSGYSLSGPVAYQQGSVVMHFAANGSTESFTLTQSQSDWDSSAVLENYIKPKANERYSIATANGLTIYTYGSDAAWVNAGILYTVSGNTTLAPEQIQKLATSL